MQLARRIPALLIGFCLGAAPVSAELWTGFYVPKTTAPADPAANRQTEAAFGMCWSEILRAEKRFGIPDNLLLAIGLQEAGRRTAEGLTVWPWTVNSAGKGRFFDTRTAMLAWIKEQQALGFKSIDVGCMQVNQKWHSQAFANLQAAVDPAENVDYAARFLRSLYNETGDWWQAAGRYHSSTFKAKAAYLERLERNLAVAAAMPKPSVGADAEPAQIKAATATIIMPNVLWGRGRNADRATADQKQAFSIYSRTPLQPFLPDYEE